MSAIVTDQFRILNANNFVESVESDNNSYYVFIGLSNPATVCPPSFVYPPLPTLLVGCSLRN